MGEAEKSKRLAAAESAEREWFSLNHKAHMADGLVGAAYRDYCESRTDKNHERYIRKLREAANLVKGADDARKRADRLWQTVE